MIWSLVSQVFETILEPWLIHCKSAGQSVGPSCSVLVPTWPPWSRNSDIFFPDQTVRHLGRCSHIWLRFANDCVMFCNIPGWVRQWCPSFLYILLFACAQRGFLRGACRDSTRLGLFSNRCTISWLRSWKILKVGETRWGTVRWNLRLELQIPLIFCFGRQTFKLLQNFVLHWWSHTKWFQMQHCQKFAMRSTTLLGDTPSASWSTLFGYSSLGESLG